MKTTEGLPFVKFMMLLSSMAPLFLLVGIRGMDNIVSDKNLWITIGTLLFIPFVIVKLRIYFSVKSNDVFVLDVSETKNNKEYLFTYLFTVLLPLYSVTIGSNREFFAIIFAICFVIFVLWNMNLHFVNILFALQGYRVYTIESFDSAILLTTRATLPKDINELKVHRLSNSVYIELKKHKYGN
ncbi:hypothetical protein DMZ43_07590 [Meridianimaribacter sp. CL38]|uniref:hypothetical protein n=1 Tax=Meridianimaribacter sp. CL38 TaxID=2213021 RepID=UPI00103914E9|nr:hypothetical protein [Meridianimaribacter sp. CL38]TBV26916.1 hypothetical protein DMZ43_07590 [Meridianimaribacter sp. CL38]